MYKIYATLIMSGEKFSPKLLEEKTGIKLSRNNEPGDVGTSGFYKEKPIPYGHASLSAPKEALDENNYYSGFEWLVNKLVEVVPIARECEVEDIYLDLAVYHGNQCNMAFEPQILDKIASVNIPFWISCYNDDELVD